MKDQDKMSRAGDDSPTAEPGTWIVRRRRRRVRPPVQRTLPQPDLLGGHGIDPDDLTDEKFHRLLFGDDDDVEIGDRVSVEDQTPLTEAESAALDRALQALVQALKEVIDEMHPDEEPEQ